MGSWKGRGNQYIQFVRVLYCKLLTNGNQLPASPLQAEPGTKPRPQRWEARVLPLCLCGPLEEESNIYCNAALSDKKSKVKACTLVNLAGPEAIKRQRNFEYIPEIKQGDEVIQTVESKNDVGVLLCKFGELCNPQKKCFHEETHFLLLRPKS